MYTRVIMEALKIEARRARLVEAYLRLQYGTLDALALFQIKDEYTRGGISDAIDIDPLGAESLAKSYGL